MNNLIVSFLKIEKSLQNSVATKHTNPEMIITSLVRFYGSDFWRDFFFGPNAIRQELFQKMQGPAMTKVPFLLHLLHCAPGGLPRSAS